jgi:Gas vesicle synthesis protein GvpL/GvpF
MSADALYLYALARHGELGDIDMDGVEEGRKVAVIACGGLDAVVSDVPRDAYEAARDDMEPADPTWVVPRALRHDQVVSEVARRASVLPARFGAVFSDNRSLTDLVGLHCELIKLYLSR